MPEPQPKPLADRNRLELVDSASGEEAISLWAQEAYYADAIFFGMDGFNLGDTVIAQTVVNAYAAALTLQGLSKSLYFIVPGQHADLVKPNVPGVTVIPDEPGRMERTFQEKALTSGYRRSAYLELAPMFLPAMTLVHQVDHTKITYLNHTSLLLREQFDRINSGTGRIARFVEYLNGLDSGTLPDELGWPQLNQAPHADETYSRLLTQYKIPSNRPHINMILSASCKPKAYSIEQYLQIAQGLQAAHPEIWFNLIYHPPSLQKSYDLDPRSLQRMINAAGLTQTSALINTTVQDLIVLFGHPSQHKRLGIGNDSGIMHVLVAADNQSPCLSIHSSGNPANEWTYGPYHHGIGLLRREEKEFDELTNPLIDMINPQRILSLALKLYEEK